MIRSSTVLFWFSLVIIASLALYRTSDRAHTLNKQLKELNTAIETEQQSLHVLKAEWAWLANPTRIEKSAKKHLALRPTSPQQIVSLAELAEVLPTRKEAMASVSVTATPMANVRTTLVMPRAKTPTKSMAAAQVTNTHINDRMIIQRTASAQPMPDSIGALINQLDISP
jgi:cell division protein FtsL